VTHRHLWAAYGVFDVVPVDLIDGPGDELVIVRIPNRGSPPHAPELQIWNLGSATRADLVEHVDDWFAGRFDTTEGAIPCARWRTRLFVKPNDLKPRPIALHADLAAEDWPPSGCHLTKKGASTVAVVRAPRVLSFERGKYRMR
jgi:hypothetical protein